ncbi:MAG: EF-hand domain-containing protein [Polyangiaceae bacterium]
MKVRILRSATIGALGIATVACSRTAPGPTPPSRNEPPATLAAGREGGPRRGCSENFRAFDDDDDGRVSLDEFNARPHIHADWSRVFRTRDRDRDGSLSENELCDEWRGDAGSSRGAGRGMGPGAGCGDGRGRRRTSQSMAGMRCEQHFAAFDSDGNGKSRRRNFLPGHIPEVTARRFSRSATSITTGRSRVQNFARRGRTSRLESGAPKRRAPPRRAHS